MRRKIGSVMTVLGLVLVLVAFFQYVEQKVKVQQALAQAENIVENKSNSSNIETSKVSDAPSDPLIAREQFNPSKHDVIGILEIPKLDAQLPIIEGTAEEMLEKGVGHYSATAFPSDGEQILLSGHRDTVFRNFANLDIGDYFIVSMPYGTFEYEIKSTEIVDKDDTSVIRSMGEEVLVVSTCYPFHFIGAAPDRYVIYAYPVTS